MSVKVQVFLGCDAKRSLSCVGRHDVVASNGTAGIERARREAHDVGWTRQRHGSKLLDVCHICSALYTMGYTGIGLPEPTQLPAPGRPLPKNIGEAADWNRWRELQEEKQRGQR